MGKKTTQQIFTLLCYILVRVIAVLILAYSIYLIIVEKVDELESRYFMIAFYSLLLLGSSFLPSIIERNWKIDIPEFMEILFIIFCIGSLLIGEIIGVYRMNSWWDGLMHTLSGSLIAIFVFSLLRMINDSEKNTRKISPLFLVFLVFCIATTVGVIWEIIEFLADTFTGSNMQRYFNDVAGEPFIGQNALKDTMLDFILNAIGALVICIIGYIDLKIKKITLIKRVKKIG
ncbi:MAG: hypothetical protein M0R05_05650 [Bacilli bacterium]|nr:hypothetical protein [Bacilli bacterium]MDD4076819.1 hypothetical protein [Bacilli bacterium]MDD4388072.1 hypothetical protein [Bacilli bacterium]